MIIEIANINDAEDILALQRLAYRSEAEIYDDPGIPPLVQTLEELRGDFTSNIFLKVVIDGRIIGSVRAFEKDGTCYVGRLIVRPDFQNHGIGTGLLNAIEGIFKKCDRFELFTGHRSERNLRLYERLGYRAFKVKKVTEGLSFIFLEKNVGPRS